MCRALDSWLTDNGRSHADFAKEVGVYDAAVVWKWRNGKAIPRRDAMRCIFRVTNGAVTPNDFYDLSGRRNQEEARHVAA